MRDSSSAVNTVSSSLEVGGQHHPLDCAETHIISLTPTHSSHDHVVSILTIKTFNTCVRIIALLQNCTCRNFRSPPPFICTGLDPLHEISSMDPNLDES